MKIIFAGTPAFAVPALAQLLSDGHEINLVLTQPDRPAGRKMQLQASEVKKFARLHKLPVATPRGLRIAGKYPEDAEQVQSTIQSLAPDALVVVAYGLMIPEWLLAIPVFGGFNVHPSRLPRWRGASPIQSALLAGDEQTGVCIMQMDSGLDTGGVYLSQSVPILPEDNAGTLSHTLSRLGADLLSQTLCNWRHLQAQPQATLGVMYAPKIEKHHTQIIWEGLALDMVNKTRAFNPHPGVYAYLRGDFVKIWDCEMGKDGDMAVVPGTIIAIHLTGIIVATGDNKTIVIKELQKSGGKRLLAREFAHGLRLCVGEAFH